MSSATRLFAFPPLVSGLVGTAAALLVYVLADRKQEEVLDALRDGGAQSFNAVLPLWAEAPAATAVVAFAVAYLLTLLTLWSLDAANLREKGGS